MRRIRDRADGRLFRGSEFPRLMAMVLMLVVLVMMMRNARDPDTWRYFAGSDKDTFTLDEILAAEQRSASASEIQDKPADERLVVAESEPDTDSRSEAEPANDSSSDSQGADSRTIDRDDPFTVTDLDPEQREAAREQFEVITDKSPLEKQDMGAYWRLLLWTKSQSFDELEKRARRDLLFTHFAEQPEKYRGQIVRLDMHLRRVLTNQTEELLPGVTRVYEAWGPTKESKANWPCAIVFPDAPEGLKFGADIKQRGLFVGYFLKLISYEAVDGKTRWAPLFIGKLRVDKSLGSAREEAAGNNNLWIWAAGAIIACFFAVRMLLMLRPRHSLASRVRGALTDRGGAADAEPVDVEQWLSDVESVASETEINPSAEHDHTAPGLNGNGSSHGHRLDWRSEQERQ
jgi:hypothetical protein